MMLTALVLATVLQEPPSAAPPRRKQVTSSVRVFIEESPDGPFAHDYYEQAEPVLRRTGTPSLGSEVWFRTVCRPQEDDRSTMTFTVPEDPSPVTFSVTLSNPTFTVNIPSSSTTTGNPRKDPIISTKAGVFGGGTADSSDGKDAPFLVGSDLDYVAAPDVTIWTPTSWLPGGTSFHLYGRALFGSLEIADLSTDLQLYSIGPRLGFPIARWGSLELDCTISAGPAYLHTGIGDAIGFDGGIGLRVSQFFTRTFSFIAELEANYFRSGNVTAFGPVVNLGFNLSW